MPVTQCQDLENEDSLGGDSKVALLELFYHVIQTGLRFSHAFTRFASMKEDNCQKRIF
jgi:hypothetical protein